MTWMSITFLMILQPALISVENVQLNQECSQYSSYASLPQCSSDQLQASAALQTLAALKGFVCLAVFFTLSLRAALTQSSIWNSLSILCCCGCWVCIASYTPGHWRWQEYQFGWYSSALGIALDFPILVLNSYLFRPSGLHIVTTLMGAVTFGLSVATFVQHCRDCCCRALSQAVVAVADVHATESTQVCLCLCLSVCCVWFGLTFFVLD